MKRCFDVLVIGGGIQGLAAAYHLSLQKNLKIGLLEQFEIGHYFGSSHGISRITRSTYANPIYIKLMQRARSYDWPHLEKALARRLVYPNPGCRFGRGKAFEGYIEAALACALDIKVLEKEEARRIFPQFRFENVSAILRDHTSGIIAAKETIDGLAKIAALNGVEIHENTKALHIESTQDPMKIVTDTEVFFAKRLVITAGPWIGELLPRLKSLLTPVRQTVGYFELCGDRESYQLETFPNWSFIGEDQVFYGLPEFGCKGIKVAQHLTSGKANDPNTRLPKGDPKNLHVLEQFVKEHFVHPIKRIVDSESCFYTNTPHEDFILDLLPGEERIAIGSACSGHGFKFAPLSGLILSELILHGKTSIPEFEEARETFRIKS